MAYENWNKLRQLYVNARGQRVDVLKIIRDNSRSYALGVRLKIVSHNFGDIEFLLSTIHIYW